jgi:hypothetical protein
MKEKETRLCKIQYQHVNQYTNTTSCVLRVR